ncbi:sulfite exporter TauE/SafE family protein [Corynebacterium uterequi]|uniref:Probable membrane transporter protein n=1 Tax=Corynebacterium uterequi TaxID=1072256 RepID=A0A0G3HL34_9CORY|nr:sulfite exporter TauE/SafE family protein [Corynebacterium uterequi]AKK11822.1 putative permease [Corynebacterium uterequi]
MMVVLSLFIGLGVGVMVGALGAGGGILSVPILVYLLNQDPHAATAESLVIVGLTALASMSSPRRWADIHFRDGSVFALISIVGAVAGSRVSPFVPAQWLMGSFCVLLAVVGVVMARVGWSARRQQHSPHAGCLPQPEASTRPTQRSWVRICTAATATGFLTGFFGVGGGFIVVPILTLVLGMAMRTASATSLVVMAITAASGLLARVGTGVDVDWLVTLTFAAASMCGGMFGGPLTRKARGYQLTLAFAVLLLGVATATAVETFG